MAFEKGNTHGKGRPKKVDEEKVNNLFLSALKDLYNTDIDEEAKVCFIKRTLMESQRGQIFIAEHLFGKAPQEIKQTNFNIETAELTDAEIKRINKALDDAY